MNDRPTPETDAAWEDELKNMLHHSRQLERERDEARAEVQAIQHWATVNGTIQMQRELTEVRKQRDEAREDGLEQARLLGMSGSREAKLISERDEARAELEQVRQDAKQHEVDCLRALGERNEAREQRDAAISIGLDAVGQLIDLHHTTPKRERNVEWECRADLLDRNFRKLEDLPDSSSHA